MKIVTDGKIIAGEQLHKLMERMEETKQQFYGNKPPVQLTFNMEDDGFWQTFARTSQWREDLLANEVGFTVEAMAQGFHPSIVKHMFKELTWQFSNPVLCWSPPDRKVAAYRKFDSAFYTGGRKNDRVRISNEHFQRSQFWTEPGREVSPRWIFDAAAHEWNPAFNGAW